jgi:hypothetical protein
LANELIIALFTLAGVCFTLCLGVFNYFKDKVDRTVSEGVRLLFLGLSHATLDGLMKGKGKGETSYINSFVQNILHIAEPRGRFRSLLLFLPVDACLFLLSGFLLVLLNANNETVKLLLPAIEFAAYLLMTGGIIFLIYCGLQLVRLLRRLA